MVGSDGHNETAQKARKLVRSRTSFPATAQLCRGRRKMRGVATARGPERRAGFSRPPAPEDRDAPPRQLGPHQSIRRRSFPSPLSSPFGSEQGTGTVTIRTPLIGRGVPYRAYYVLPVRIRIVTVL
jgi:hypothetical protein